MSQHRPSRINPDTLPVLVLAVLLTAGLAGVSFTISYAALREVSAWATVPTGLAWTVPVMLDAATVVYLLAVVVKRARHERATGAWAALVLWTAVSVTANAAHAYGVPDELQRLVGTVVAALAPIAVLLATHTIADLIVARTDATSATVANTDTAAASAVQDDSAEADDVAESDTADTDDPSGASASGPTDVRRHTSPRPRTRGRAAEYRDVIVRLAADGLSVREIEGHVPVRKSAIAELLRREHRAGVVRTA
ncbi:DUF2637 domain-containing protein [Isoptericola sp. QY 916]|uniref:DUF2637 domain-containing protein n=1 Tax=Isoptericola sp. QY 916 TaxID=2782570 RepID=UPI003D2FBD25|nr:DUF2637 domain-containing protein [Isoptericola sp. QY 916]